MCNGGAGCVYSPRLIGRLAVDFPPMSTTGTQGVRIDATPEQLAAVKFDEHGLVPAIVQAHDTKQILMVAWMNAETLALTFAEGRTVFWSRSRKEVWRKGDTSGEVQLLREAYFDCDKDVLLFIVEQQGAGACQTGAYSCFFRAFGPNTGPDA
jgi:phosphoribosyl-AMP cyclohydrolase